MKNKVKNIMKIIGFIGILVVIITIFTGLTSLLDMEVSHLLAIENGDYKLSRDIYVASKIKSVNILKIFIWGGLVSAGCLFLGVYDN